jgi:putative ABC transport system substrate-binding protein
LVDAKVNVIVGWQTPAVTAARDATKDIPIVMAAAGDPVGTGLVASLSRPGGNVTGLGGGTAELSAKNLELMRELLPQLRRIGILVNGTDPFGKPFREHLAGAADALGIVTVERIVERSDELESAFAALAEAGVEAVIVQPSLPHRRSVSLALKHKLPAISPNRGFAEMGGLLAYNANAAAMQRQAASYIERILKGEKPADLPVQGPTVFELIVNLKTATALGLIVPPTLLARADEVIE